MARRLKHALTNKGHHTSVRLIDHDSSKHCDGCGERIQKNQFVHQCRHDTLGLSLKPCYFHLCLSCRLRQA